MAFDISTAIPVEEKPAQDGQQPSLVRKPGFDIENSDSVTVDEKGMTGYDHFVAGQLDAQVKAAIHQPIDENQVKYIQDTEKQDPGAFQSFAVPYTEGIVGFFTKPFGYRPDLSKPFGLTKGPKGQEEQTQDQLMAEQHPIATTLGQIVAGTAPFIATAPLFPQSLLGTLATFETVGLTQKAGEIATDESLMTPLGQKGAELGIEAVKSGIMAPIWHYSGALKFIGRPFLSAVTRAGVRGAGQATLSTVFGTDLAQALKEGGTITALSLIFEAPALAKTALGRGIINRANEIAAAKGLPEGKFTINVDKLDEASTRQSLFNMVRGFYNLMRYPIEKAQAEAAPGPGADPYARFLAGPSAPETPGQAIAPIVTLVPPGGGQPMAGGMVHQPEKQPIFYSKMMATLAEKMPEKATPEQVQGIIKGAGISPDEVDMSNLGDFLKGKDKIAKSDLLDYLKQNQMQVEEVWKGLKEGILPGDWNIVKGENGIWVAYDANDEPQITGKSKEEVTQKAIEFANQLGIETTDAKYRQYILPEGDNYREVLLKAPREGQANIIQSAINQAEIDGDVESVKLLKRLQLLEKNRSQSIYQQNGYDLINGLNHARQISPGEQPEGDKGEFLTDAGVDRARAYLGGLNTMKNYEGFKSSHWDEPNILAHARLTDRKTTDGKKVLFVEEIQSDWAREAKADKSVLPTVPSHSLLKHWQPLVLKRLLRMAAEEGYDYISWTTGEQQAERYDLSKKVSLIKVSHSAKDTVYLQIWDENSNKINLPNPHISKNDLSNVIGKDLADKIKADVGLGKNQHQIREYTGSDLKVGGGWAKNLYDQQIPNWLNDYLKKFGSNVEAIKIKGANPELTVKEVGNDFNVMNQGKLVFQGSEEEAQTYIDNYNAGYNAGESELIQQAVPITPELKNAILYQGQPVFGKMPADIGQPAAESKAWKFIFRMTDSVEITNTKGEKVTLPKGEEYHTLDVLDKDGNVVTGKIRLQDGKQVTVYEGELNKLKGHLLPIGEQPMAGGLTHPPAPEENQPPEGEQPNEDELRAAWESEMDRETQARKEELKDYLSGKLKYELKNKGEYEDLKHLSWLWAKQGERGYGPDELTELSGMGFDVGDPADSGFDGRVIELIKSYFNEDIQAKAADAVARADKSARQDKIRINESLMKKYHRDIAKALHIRAIEAAKMVVRIEKILSKPLARNKVKQIIRENTGIIKISDVIGEDEALRRLMQREQAVSKEAFRTGKETGREELKTHQAEIKARKEAKEFASEEVKGMINDIREIGDHLGVLPVDYQDSVKEILSQYDIPDQGFKRSTKTLAVRDARRRYIQEMEEAGEEVNIPEDELDLLEKITPNEMTVDDLRRVHLTLQRLYYQGKIKNKLIAAMEARDFEETKEEGIKTITEGEGLAEENNIVKMLKEQNKGMAKKGWDFVKNFIYEHLRPEIMIHGLDGWEKGINTKVMWEPLFNAFVKEELDSAEAFNKIQEILEPLDLKNAYDKQYQIGRFQGMTKSNAYFVYANSFNEHSYQALINSGFTEEDITVIENSLRAEEKSAIQNLIKYYSDVQYSALDKVHVLLNGIHMGKEEFYFPMLNLESKDGLLKDLENQILKRFKFKVAGVSSGFTKGRVTHKSGFQHLDFFGVVLKNWEQVEHYKAFAPIIRDIRKYLGNLEIKKSIENKFGKEYYDILQKFLRDVAYGGDQTLLTSRDKFVQRLRTNYMKAVLSINLLSPLRQFLGILPAMHFVGKVPVMKAMLKYSSNPVKWWKFTDDKSPLLKFRAFSSEREMREMIARRDPEHRLQKFTGATNLTEAGMLPLIYTDKLICQIIWLGAYDSTIEKGGSEDSAVAFGDETVRRTQNMGDIIFLADAFRGGVWDKVFTTFKNENNQNFNLNYENIMKSKEGQQGWGHFVDGVILMFILPALLYGWSQRKRIQESAREVLNDMAGQALGGLMYVGDFTNFISGKTQGQINPVTTVAESAIRVFTAKKLETKLDNALKTIAFTYGLPYIGLKRLITGQPLGKPAKSKKGGYGGIRPIYQ